jgi:hypothetical protein
MDVGPAKLRPRYTSEVVAFDMTLVLTTAQVTTLENFYTAALAFGSLSFTWIHPRTLAAATIRFVSRPTYSKLSGGYHETRFNVEIMP